VKAAAPIARFALVYAAGVAAGLMSVPVWISLLTGLVACAAPKRPSGRLVEVRAGLIAVAVAGALAGYATSSTDGTTADGLAVCAVDSVLTGRFLSPPLSESTPLARDDGCGVMTVVLPETDLDATPREARAAGKPVRVRGRQREGRHRPWFAATHIEAVDRVEPRLAVVDRVHWGAVRLRGGLVRRIHELYGVRAPLITALTLARTEGLDRDVRDSFAGAGIAHLLAISGFHVGVVAGLVSIALTALPWGRRRKRLLAAAVTAGYVALIGFPVSACRAALIILLTALSVALGRVPSRWGALGGAALILLWIDPRELANAGFQLSFAGAAGLVAWAGPLESWLLTHLRGPTHRAGRTVTSSLAAGIAATVATLPFVAWHFGRVALLGIPATLVATPLVSLALPGALLSLVVGSVSESGGMLLAGGVSVLLDALALVARVAADAPMASVWVSPPSVLAGSAGVLVASWLARHPGVDARGRSRITLALVVSALVAWPTLLAWEGGRGLDLWMIDVGQGDALAVRTPGGSWILVDAGPPSDAPIPAQPVVQTLRSLGVRRIELLVLTHPDADHIGGVPGVLRSFHVTRVLEPALPVGKRVYGDAMAEAEVQGVSWDAARAGQRFVYGGVSFEVLHPTDSAVSVEEGRGSSVEANRVSVVLRVSWQGVDIVLTGDAYVDVEETLMAELGDIDILKIGHHGSRTSTSGAFLRTTTPEHALISAGRTNRYGHPAPGVLARLEDAGVTIHRTDEMGTVRVRVGRDGHVHVQSMR
jgi:competence protein ComEC